MKRPPDSASRVIAVIAAIAGVRAGICMIAVPSRMRVVCAPIQASGVIASEPYASAVHTESKPRLLGFLDQIHGQAHAAPRVSDGQSKPHDASPSSSEARILHPP